eukprot:7757632-Pyramimonas_sp.AAC.1
MRLEYEAARYVDRAKSRAPLSRGSRNQRHATAPCCEGSSFHPVVTACGCRRFIFAAVCGFQCV